MCRGFKEGFRKEIIEQRPEGVRVSQAGFWVKAFLAEETAGAKAPRQK